MPYVKVEMGEGRTEEQKARLAQAITAAIEEHIGAKPESTYVVFQDVPKQNWAIGGKLLSQK
jgi:4-oxalocrotonate tautomerase